jgi:hypothetical protein
MVSNYPCLIKVLIDLIVLLEFHSSILSWIRALENVDVLIVMDIDVPELSLNTVTFCVRSSLLFDEIILVLDTHGYFTPDRVNIMIKLRHFLIQTIYIYST